MTETLQEITGNYYLVFVALVFVAVMLLLEGLYLLWKTRRNAGAKKLAQRLELYSAQLRQARQAAVLKQGTLSELPALERMLRAAPRVLGLQKLLQQSGLGWTVSRLLLSCALAGLAGYVLAYVLARQSALVSLVAAGLLAWLPVLWVAWRRSRRLAVLERQLPEAIALVTRALRAGHAFPSGLQMIGEEMHEPIASEFRAVHEEINFGVSLQQALFNLSDRVPVTDLRYFVVAVLIQRESGGNLTEILSNLSHLIRARLKLFARVRVLSSEGRLSAWILGLMPFGLGFVMNIVNPEFMSPLWTDPIGIAMMQYTLGLMVIGIFILRKIIRIRV